jgi:hypothetical protein
MATRVGNRSWYLEMIDVATEANDGVQAVLEQGTVDRASTDRLRRLSLTLRSTIAEYNDLAYPEHSSAAAMAPATPISVLELPARVMRPLSRSCFTTVERIEQCLKTGPLVVAGIGAKGRAQIAMAVAIYRAGGVDAIVDEMAGA